MSKLSDVTFPATADQLASMDSASLRVLVGKLPNAKELHPQIASMGYHMTKAERVDFIGYHFYGVGTPEKAAAALSNAENKYITLKASKGPATGLKAAEEGPNCAASMASQMVTAAETEFSPLDIAKQDALNYLADNIGSLGDEDVLNALNPTIASVSNIAGDDGVADLLLNGLNTYKLAYAATPPEDAAGWLKLAQLAEGDLSDIAAAPVADQTQLQPLTDALKITKAHAASQATQLSIATADEIPFVKLVQSVDGAIENLPASDILEALDDTASKLGLTKANKLTPGVYNQIDTDLANALEHIGEAVKTGEVSTAEASQLDYFSSVGPQTKEAAKELAQTVTDAETAAAASSNTEAIAASQSQYAALSKADLKKIAPEKFATVTDTPSLAHYLTKDELAEALAKIDNGADIGDLLDTAKEKKAVHKGQAVAKAASEKVPDSPVPAFEASPDVATATELTEPDALAAAEADPADPLYIAQTDTDMSTALADSVPQTKYPKPPQVEHTFTVKAHQPSVGGAHRKELYTDENGNVWMVKIADTPGVAQGEALAHDIGFDLGFDMADIRPVENFKTSAYGTFKNGTIQQWHTGVKGAMSDFPVTVLSDEQLAELQQHQVFDWLISQHDTHDDNILVMADGHLAPIDKGQAFKFFGNDRLEVGYKPPGNFGQSVYDQMWGAYRSGGIDLNLDAIDSVLGRIENLSDQEYEAKVRAYVHQRVVDGGKSMTFLPADLRKEDSLVQAIVARKNDIREQFTAFYRDQAKARGVTWNPVWEQRLAKVEPDVAEAIGYPAAAAGITTPITQQLADSVDHLGIGGKAIHFAGKDINQGQGLVWTELAPDGSKVLRMEVRLEPEADARTLKLFAAEGGDAGTANAAMAGGPSADPFIDKIVAGAKTVSTHAGDGLYTQTTLDNMHAAQGVLETAVKNGAKADKLLADGKIEVESWASAKADAEQAQQYLGYIDQIDQAKAAGVKPGFLAQKFDTDAATKGWLAKAPEAEPTPIVEAPPSLFTKPPKVGRERFPVMKQSDGFMTWQRTGQTEDVEVNPGGSFGHGLPGKDPSLSVGRQYDATMDVRGQNVDIHYRANSMTSAVPGKGRVDMELANWTGSADDIQRLTDVLGRLGVDAPLATADDEALTYWRVLTGDWKNTVEYNNPGAASAASPYSKIRSTIDTIEARVAAAGNLTPQAEADIYREEMGKTFGDDTVAKAREQILHHLTIKGDETSGYGYYERFDMPDNLQELYTRQGKTYAMTHGLKDVKLDPTVMVDQNGTASTSELVRMGQYGQRGTTSAEADMSTGGAQSVFTSQGHSHYAGGGSTIVYSPSTLGRRVGNYSFSSDDFGRLGQRTSRSFLDPARMLNQLSTDMSSSNETMVRGLASFGEDTEAVIVRAASKRTEILKALSSEGITEIRGVPIEERVLVAKSDAEVVAITNKFSAAHADSFYTRRVGSLTDVRAGAVPEPIPVKAKVTKAAKAAAQKAAAAIEVPAPPALDITTDTLGQLAGSLAFGDVGEIQVLNDAGAAIAPYGKDAGWVSDQYSLLAQAKGVSPEFDTPTSQATFDQLLTEHIPGYLQAADATKTFDTVGQKLEALGQLPVSSGKQAFIAELVGQPDWPAAVTEWLGDTEGEFTMENWANGKAMLAQSKIGADAVADIPAVVGKITDVGIGPTYQLKGVTHPLSAHDVANMKEALSAVGDDATVPNFLNAIPADEGPTASQIQENLGAYLKQTTGSSAVGPGQTFANLKAMLDDADQAFGTMAIPSEAVPMIAAADAPFGSVGELVIQDPVAKVFNYNLPGVKGKLPVQFVPAVNGTTTVIAKTPMGDWQVVAQQITGKTNKDALLELLKAAQWPGVQP